MSEVFPTVDLGRTHGSSVEPRLLDALFMCSLNVSPPLRILCRSLQDWANGSHELALLLLCFSPSWLACSSDGILTRTSMFSITVVGTVEGGSRCCHTGALESSLSCLLNFMMTDDVLLMSWPSSFYLYSTRSGGHSRKIETSKTLLSSSKY